MQNSSSPSNPSNLPPMNTRHIPAPEVRPLLITSLVLVLVTLIVNFLFTPSFINPSAPTTYFTDYLAGMCFYAASATLILLPICFQKTSHPSSTFQYIQFHRFLALYSRNHRQLHLLPQYHLYHYQYYRSNRYQLRRQTLSPTIRQHTIQFTKFTPIFSTPNLQHPGDQKPHHYFRYYRNYHHFIRRCLGNIIHHQRLRRRLLCFNSPHNIILSLH